MKTNDVTFEDVYVNDEYETTTYYFSISKTLLEELTLRKYPDADSGEIAIEFPTGCPEAAVSSVMISPTMKSDYDWEYLEMNYEDIEKLLAMADGGI